MITEGHGREAKRAAILEALRVGNTRKASAGAAGIDETTLYAWLKDPSFSLDVKLAESEAQLLHVGNIAKAAAMGTWQASAWLLERRHEEWRRRDTLDVFAKMSPEQLVATIMEEEPKALGSGEEEG